MTATPTVLQAKTKEIKGTDILLLIGGVPIAGQRDCTLTMSGDSIDTTTKDTEGWKTSIAGLKSWSTSFSQVDFNGDDGQSQAAFEKAFIEGRNVQCIIREQGRAIYSGEAAIISKDINGNNGDVASGQYSLSGASKLTIKYVPWIQKATFSGTTVTIKLTEQAAAANTDVVTESNPLAKCIVIGTANPTAATISEGSISCTMSSAPSAGDKVQIGADTLKNDTAIQTGVLTASLEAAA